MRKSGSIAQMKSLVSELLQYKVAPEDLEEWVPEQEGCRLLAWKLEECENRLQRICGLSVGTVSDG